jgi:hypothetical protein
MEHKEYTVTFHGDEECECTAFVTCTVLDKSEIEFDVLYADGVRIEFLMQIKDVYETPKEGLQN